MKVLTLHQPWASLVALGVKTIETRSWSTSYRGPLAIHAGASFRGIDDELECEEAGWRAAQIGGYQASYCYRTSDEGVRGQTMLVATPGAVVEPSVPIAIEDEYSVMPVGAIVATCTLVDVVPIGGPSSFRTGLFDGDEGDLPGRPVVVHHPAYAGLPPVHGECLVLDDDGRQTDITDQLPYGDFTPGRFAWLLADVEPVDPPVPFKGGQGLTKTWEPVAA